MNRRLIIEEIARVLNVSTEEAEVEYTRLMAKGSGALLTVFPTLSKYVTPTRERSNDNRSHRIIND